jgi:hypothetical protein
MQAAVDEIRCEIHQQWPRNRVGTHERDPVTPQKRYELRRGVAVVSDFHGVTQGSVAIVLSKRSLAQPAIVLTRHSGRGFRVPW